MYISLHINAYMCVCVYMHVYAQTHETPHSHNNMRMFADPAHDITQHN